LNHKRWSVGVDRVRCWEPEGIPEEGTETEADDRPYESKIAEEAESMESVEAVTPVESAPATEPAATVESAATVEPAPAMEPAAAVESTAASMASTAATTGECGRRCQNHGGQSDYQVPQCHALLHLYNA
jgi:hypothetical protein